MYHFNTNLSIAIRNKLQNDDVLQFAVDRLKLVDNEVFAVRTQRFVVNPEKNGSLKTLTHIAALLLNLHSHSQMICYMLMTNILL